MKKMQEKPGTTPGKVVSAETRTDTDDDKGRELPTRLLNERS